MIYIYIYYIISSISDSVYSSNEKSGCQTVTHLQNENKCQSKKSYKK